MSKVHIFSNKGCTMDKDVWESCGKRGKRAFELASLNLPIVPGFIVDSFATAKIETANIPTMIQEGLAEIEKGIGRKFGDPENPLLLKVICSTNLTLPIYPTVFNIGLSPKTISGFAKIFTNETKAWYEYCYFLKTAAVKLYGMNLNDLDTICPREIYSSPNEQKAAAERICSMLGEDKVADDPFLQLEIVMRAVKKRYYDPDLDEQDNVAIMVQGMVFGNIGDDDVVGMYHTRSPITGARKLSGTYNKKAYTLDSSGEDINSLEAERKKELQEIAKLLEHKYHELREVKFIVESGKLWLINQTSEDKKSTQAHMRTLLDLMKEDVISPESLLKEFQPVQLASLLHKVVNPDSTTDIPSVSGGLAGAPGAAVGRVYFSADSLMEAHQAAMQKGEDTRMILCVVSSFAEDVKAIEVGQGVIAAEGGYSSHAPVVARSMGKVAVVSPEMQIRGNEFSLQGQTVKEGDYITLDVPVHKSPSIYLGKAELINPDIEKNGLIELIDVIKKFIKPDFIVRANADLERDAKLALKMGAFGIGLCRTEHMFFSGDRIMLFREMILANSTEKRIKILKELQPLQRQDFYKLFQTMAPYPVTIRLLDAPLHEFLPRNDQVLQEYLDHLANRGGEEPVVKERIQERIERLHEFNPMLGHRGCRTAITFPEIYEMQVSAILEAAIQLKNEGVEVIPEIMIPLIMNASELNMIRNGKKIEGKTIPGIIGIADSVFKKEGVKVQYKVGTMVELPAAALISNELARYADFFSYGTNDLTQTTHGISRDDINSFFPAYTEYDLLAHNPFQILESPVKELIQLSSSRSRLTRPDIKLGLCGEHGADPDNIHFCREAGLQYVSCSPYSIPIALHAVARQNIENGVV